MKATVVINFHFDVYDSGLTGFQITDLGNKIYSDHTVTGER